MRTFSSDNLDTLDMRASTLTFIFIISECSIITGGDGNCRDPPEIKNAKIVKNVTHRFRMNCTEGYSRKVGSSNLFKCENNTWRNIPPLVCIQLVGPTPSVSPSQSSLTQKVTGMKEKGQSTTNGKTVFTTTHKATTTSQTSYQTYQRTTTMEETSVTTPITARITSSSTTEKEILITMSTSSSLITTGYGVTDKIKDNRKQILGISLGIVVLVILGVAVAVAVLFMCRRSKSHRAGGNPVHMKCLTLGSEHPLIMNVTSSGAPDSVQSSFTPFKDASENMYTDDPLSV
ncbi:interleukin-15 receptor subunit alpha isoform X1 [Tachysurus fulvidraco]|uniref:interleukin-15 receptor subunit alpha isoform X1 n=1 Tax=Tachysurus fulvidraco TaxID=1234273 RepID=UPI000F517037|nr:interleukin-15 receptor subunit alpha isoform X1 [Tachysurus fulvidraco]XP_027009758.1 interleukin-15 receptor subunit alpha isoform X1 [Tachysurus fulvidraco]XP_047660115.1 interleukin-15 receptor subunit alpha isoform X1 [Tachysurus fulvidraco]